MTKLNFTNLSKMIYSDFAGANSPVRIDTLKNVEFKRTHPKSLFLCLTDYGRVIQATFGLAVLCVGSVNLFHPIFVKLTLALIGNANYAEVQNV